MELYDRADVQPAEQTGGIATSFFSVADVSQLRLSAPSAGDFMLNVTAFSSPIYGQLNSAQCRARLDYFPIKAHQPEIQLDVQFESERAFDRFQQWVRRTQVGAQGNSAPLITLSWPERSIKNWSGVIKDFRAGGMRRNYAPRARFVIELVTSLVSSRTDISSFGLNFFTAILGSDGLLQAPAGASSFGQFFGQLFNNGSDLGAGLFGSGNYQRPY